MLSLMTWLKSGDKLRTLLHHGVLNYSTLTLFRTSIRNFFVIFITNTYGLLANISHVYLQSKRWHNLYLGFIVNSLISYSAHRYGTLSKYESLVNVQLITIFWYFILWYLCLICVWKLITCNCRIHTIKISKLISQMMWYSMHDITVEIINNTKNSNMNFRHKFCNTIKANYCCRSNTICQ